MPKTPLNAITEQQWLEAVETFELGLNHAVQIARELGVSPSTVSRQFRRRGARKGCRVAETVAELNAALDARDCVRAQRREAQEVAAAERGVMLDKLIGEMMRSLIAAERAGNLASAAPKVAEVGRALGVKGAEVAI